MSEVCPVCGSSGWVCETHTSEPMSHKIDGEECGGELTALRAERDRFERKLVDECERRARDFEESSEKFRRLTAENEQLLASRDEYKQAYEKRKVDMQTLLLERDQLRTERDELIKAHDTQVYIAKEFQKLFRKLEPEMSRLTAEVEQLRARLSEQRK